MATIIIEVGRHSHSRWNNQCIGENDALMLNVLWGALEAKPATHDGDVTKRSFPNCTYQGHIPAAPRNRGLVVETA